MKVVEGRVPLDKVLLVLPQYRHYEIVTWVLTSSQNWREHLCTRQLAACVKSFLRN